MAYTWVRKSYSTYVETIEHEKQKLQYKERISSKKVLLKRRNDIAPSEIMV